MGGTPKKPKSVPPSNVQKPKTNERVENKEGDKNRATAGEENGSQVTHSKNVDVRGI